MSYPTLPDFRLPENRRSVVPVQQSGNTQTTSSEHGQTQTTSSEHSLRRPRPYPAEPAPRTDQVPPAYWPARTEADDPRNTWVIEHDRPRDFYNRGPYGTPGWRPDPRTGRHRRGEAPDPIPAPATKEDYEARLREIAFERFIRKSAGLAAAHVSHRKPSVAVRFGKWFKASVRTVTRAQRPSPSVAFAGQGSR